MQLLYVASTSGASVCVCAIAAHCIYKCLCISCLEILNEHCRSHVCIRAWVGVSVCVRVRVMQYQSHCPQPFVRGKDRERVPDPNWASGTLHTSPVIRCVHLMQYQALTTLLLIQTIQENKWLGASVCECVCVCEIVTVCT